MDRSKVTITREPYRVEGKIVGIRLTGTTIVKSEIMISNIEFDLGGETIIEIKKERIIKEIMELFK